MHFVIYLPERFYSAIASTFVESLQTINDLEKRNPLTFEFVSPYPQPLSRSGILYSARRKPSRKMDVLVLLSGAGAELAPSPDLLEKEARNASRLLQQASKDNAVIAATCGAAWILAASGLLHRKRATISWWLKDEARQRFPRVKWEPSRIVVRDGRMYTTGGGFSGLELITTLLSDLGFAEQERRMRKIMVLPPARQYQSPYEMVLDRKIGPFEAQLNGLAVEWLDELTVPLMARQLGLSSRTLSRKFAEELQTSPGKWIQQKRIETAKSLLEETGLTVSEICFKVGYGDLAAFTRLFTRSTGMSPTEFRKSFGRR
jgi:transcriptional regulator GlxA family with amidase domain